MRLFLWGFSALLLLLGTALCDKLECALACQTVGSILQFNSTVPLDNYYAQQCAVVPRVETIFVCMRSYCTEKQIEAGMEYFTGVCKEAFVDLLPFGFIDNITDAMVQKWPRIDLETMNEVQYYDTPAFIVKTLFQLSFRTQVDWDKSVVNRANYGYAMFGFFGIVIFVGTLSRVISYAHVHLHDKSFKESTTPPLFSGIQRMTKRYISTPALFSHRAAEPLAWCTVPPRVQSLTIAAFVIINVVLCCSDYSAFENNLNWTSTHQQLWRYVADRTGVISLANMVLIWAFGTRNNVLLWLTGWDFATFNHFHRWVARVSTIQAIVHSIAYSVCAFMIGGKEEYDREWTLRFFWMGVIATFTMSFAIGLSILPMRRYFYDAFLMIHIVLGVLTLVGMYYHVEAYDAEYKPYIWTCVALWSFDRALRLGRIALLNFAPFKATAKFNPKSDTIRIQVSVRTGVRPSPGTYYYLYTLHGAKFWESHPFTLAAWDLNDNTAESDASRRDKTISFMLRPQKGFTARLRNQLVTRQEKEDGTLSPEKSLRVIIEGPYGTGHSVELYDSALFVIGGMGITVALAHIQALHETLTEKRPSKLRAVRLVWAMRDIALFQDVYERELSSRIAALRSHGSVDFKVETHVTKQSVKMSVSDLMSNTDEEGIENAPTKQTKTMEKETNVSSIEPADNSTKAATVTPLSPGSSLGAGHSDDERRIKTVELATGVSLFGNRPWVQDVVLASAQECQSTGGKLAVVCCGPASLTDDTRAAVVLALGDENAQIDFYPEHFNW